MDIKGKESAASAVVKTLRWAKEKGYLLAHRSPLSCHEEQTNACEEYAYLYLWFYQRGLSDYT